MPREGVWLRPKPKRNSSSCPGLGSLRVASLTAVEGGLEFVVAERQLGSRGNRLRGGVFVTDRIWDQLEWFRGDVGENRSTEVLSSLFLSSPGVLGTEKLHSLVFRNLV